MNKRQLNYAIKDIERTYKQYIGERTDGTASIGDVARWFGIELDENRLSDYYIETIDFEVPSIVLIDSETRTAYRATYTNEAEMFHTSGSEVRFICVNSYNAAYTTESLYHLKRNGASPLIASKTIIKDDDFELIFMMEHSHRVGVISNVGDKFTIGYDRVLRDENDRTKTRRQPLLTKVYKEFGEGNLSRKFDYMFTYSTHNYITLDDEQDSFTFSDESGVEYVVNNYVLKDERSEYDSWIYGFAYENLTTSRKRKLPLPEFMDLLNATNAPELYDSKVKSAIRFKGCAHQELGGELEVYKSNDALHVRYNAHECDMVCHDDDFYLPILAPGNISIEELDSIISFLNDMYAEDEFIRQVIIQLLEFRRKICINKGFTVEEEDDLSPKIFLNKTTSEIERMVTENKKAYFRLAASQFQTYTHLGETEPEDIKSFRMRRRGN